VSPAAARAAISRFTLRVPDSWFEFDVWRATRTGDLARLVDGRIARQPGLRPYRATLLTLLREVAERAERQGAVYCATATQEETGASGIVATLLVFHTPGPGDPAEATAIAIAGGVSAVARTEPGTPWRTVEIVTVPAGEAVRVQGIERSFIDGIAFDSVTMQTLAPVPTAIGEPGDDEMAGGETAGGETAAGTGGSASVDGVLNVVLTSPHVTLADELLDLFGAISDTLAWSADSSQR